MGKAQCHLRAVAVSLGFQQSPVSAILGGGNDSPRGAPARLTPLLFLMGMGKAVCRTHLRGRCRHRLEGTELCCTVTAAVPQLSDVFE